MTWIVADKDEQEFLSQLATYPDRIVGLLAVTIVDDRLERAIRAQWQDIPNKDFLENLFNDNGPFGNFGIKIKIGFGTHMYGLEAYNDLRILATIRNAFAHQVGAKDFQTPGIKSLSDRLVLPDKYPASPESGRGIFAMSAG